MAVQWSRLYKYVPLKYVVDIIENNRLYLSDGTTFNDPFEVTITERGTKQINHIKGLHILSLTNSPRKKLMWSHYTESHKGVCLTVEIPAHLAYSMCYSRQRVFSDSNIEQIIKDSKKNTKKNLRKSYSNLSNDKKIAFIKDAKWFYENEYRVVFDKSDEKGLIFQDGKWYMSVKIINIYLGVNFQKNEPKIQKEILEACNKNKIKVKQMKLGENDYSLKVIE